MKIEIKSKDDYIMLSLSKASNTDDLGKWTEILQDVLKYSFEGSMIYLFTLSPQKYSLGYELGSYKEFKIGDEKVLINYLEQCTEDQIAEVANSEEFSRGLLKIGLSNERKLFNNLNFINGDYSVLKDELITCESDGYSFYWYNPHLLREKIEQKLNAIISSHTE